MEADAVTAYFTYIGRQALLSRHTHALLRKNESFSPISLMRLFIQLHFNTVAGAAQLLIAITTIFMQVDRYF